MGLFTGALSGLSRSSLTDGSFHPVYDIRLFFFFIFLLTSARRGGPMEDGRYR
jgi:hypothetical protein